MIDGWKNESLQELISYISKGIPPSYVEIANENTICVLNQKCNRDFSISYIESRLHDLSKKKVSSEKYLCKGDILINSTGKGTAGRIAQIYNLPCPTIVDGHMIILRGNDKVVSRYLGYALKAQQFKVLQLDEGSTGQTELNRQRLLQDIYISYPVSLIEQENIVKILSALDDKIELNKKINKTLEEMAKAIWAEKFGNSNENGLLGDIIELFDYKRVPIPSEKRKLMKNIYPYYGAASLMDYVDNYLFDGIYVLLGEDGTVTDNLGYPMLQYVWGKFWVNNHAHIMRGRNGFTVESLYILLKHTNVRSIVTGAVQPKINQMNLKNLSVFIPKIEDLENFNKLIDPMFSSIRVRSIENIHLFSIRDILLPKLMSGEIRVK